MDQLGRERVPPVRPHDQRLRSRWLPPAPARISWLGALVAGLFGRAAHRAQLLDFDQRGQQLADLVGQRG